ncbi:MAG: co-chaperone GroES [Gammaproteobacteria bacterium]|nr:MAG: co-chaperone GroES [Gammaproteobacteria bacterium]UTW43009.1 co-chaperone GroES [bacterium SCSIO 12844]
MSIRPLHDRVLVIRAEEETTTAGGLVLPGSASEKPVTGEVVAVGNGKILSDGTTRPLDVKVGDTILFGKYSGTEVKLDGQEYLVMREEDIMGVVVKETAKA